MPLVIYNSLTKKKEPFVPVEKGLVRMYVCGPTVYDDPHIGHVRSAYVFEIIKNFLEYTGYRVQMVRNITDIDDKIIERAKSLGDTSLKEAVQKISEKYLQSYREELRMFGIQTGTREIKEPPATAHVPDMINLIKRLLEKGYAYPADGDIYFDVRHYKSYGQLSHQKPDSMLEGTRLDTNQKKKDSLDFALWKKAEEEPFWDSPWGKGRPGWHIECSAMSMKYLGETFDIHGGGLDLIFPHHENEIAQSESATGKPLARYWVHHGLVTHDGHKMSKSLKNAIFCRELTMKRQNRVDSFKLLFLGTHYRAPLDYTERQWEMARAIHDRFDIFFRDMEPLTGYSAKTDAKILEYEEKFRQAMDDDFNTPQVMGLMHEMMHSARKTLDPGIVLGIGAKLKEFGKILGLFSGKKDTPSTAEEEEDRKRETRVHDAIQKRYEAKKKKDFKAADEIREKLAKETGVELIDLADGKTIGRRRID